MDPANGKLPSQHNDTLSVENAVCIFLWYPALEPDKHTPLSFNLRASDPQYLSIQILGILLLALLPVNLLKTKIVNLFG